MTPDPYASYLRQADELFARDEIVKAGQIWQAILKQVPTHVTARSGLLKVKARLEAQKAHAPEPPPPAPGPSAEEVDKLLREGCTLYDLGQLEDALRKWDQLLALAPDHDTARQYAAGARRELGLSSTEVLAPAPLPPAPGEALVARSASAPTRPADMPTMAPPARPAPAASPRAADPAAVELKVRQGEHLLSLQRYDEASFTFRQALELQPDHAQAQAGLRQAMAGPGEPASAPPTLAPTDFGLPMGLEPEAPAEAPQAEAPASAVPPTRVTRALPPAREGLRLPSGFDKVRARLDRFPQAKDPKVLGAAAGGLLLFFTTCGFVRSHRVESRRSEAVQAVTQAAVSEVAQDTQAVDLSESPRAVLQEAQEALGAEPLLAYLRAEYALKLAPGDGAAAQLFEKAKADMAGGVVGASAAEAQRHVLEGNLEAAAKVYDAVLRADPSDGLLRAKAARVQLRLAADFAGQENWEKAAERLRMGRALQPGDRSWGLRLRILDQAKALHRGPERESWLSFLG